ncbi:MAG TPA: phosphatase PAP2 family protein, partial [Candidatus Kryptobacter bacterium]|nr:phosphatase PAP2 family protein [Candidatus Kryptobacter bacterium]
INTQESSVAYGHVAGEERELSWMAKVGLIAVTFIIHVTVWHFINQYNALRPASELNDLSMAADYWISYLGWSWPVYYFAHLFVTIGGSLIIWRLPARSFVRIIVITAVMIATAGVIQIIIPARSPLPDEMNRVHAWFHRYLLNDPYVCFPSLHVALSILPACIGIRYFKGARVKWALCIAVVLIFISTVTLKEHYLIDSIAGGIFGLAFFEIYNLLERKDKRSGALASVPTDETAWDGSCGHHES